MVNVETKYSKLCEVIGKKISLEKLEGLLFDMGFELENVEGDEIKVEITAERPDLLSTYGLARAIKSFMGEKNKPYKVNKSNDKVFIKDTIKEWPFSVAAVVKNIKFDDEKIKEIIRIQEKLGATFLRNRKKGAIGIYPLEKIKFPITFSAENPEKFKFRPLEYEGELNGWEILDKHPTGIKYKDVVKGWKKLPLFRDGNNGIMSMPPITNSHELGKINEKTTDVFVEASGIDKNTIKIAINVLVGALIDMGGDAYSLEINENGKKFVFPSFEEEERKINVDYINSVIGSDFKAGDVKKLLEKMDYHVKNVSAGEVKFSVPATRSDIWHDIDIVDDVARAYGFNNFELSMKPINTIGGTTDSVKIKDDFSNLITGLGFQEMFTLVLSSTQDQFENMKIKDFGHINLGNSVEKSVNMLRVWLIPELLKCLRSNRSVEYPQRIFEINRVVIPDETRDVKSKDILRMCGMVTHKNASFTEIKQVLDFLFKAIDVEYEIKAVSHDSFIPGRVARVYVKGKGVAYVGEIHPDVLNNFELENPVSCFELNLSDLMEVLKK